MIEFDFERLRALGLTPAMAQRAALQAAIPEGGRGRLDDGAAPTADARALRLMRLVEIHRETLRVHDGTRDHAARVAPRLARALDDADEGGALAVGDWVGVDAGGDGALPWVHQRVPPLTHLARRDGDGRRHAVVSNVDIALLVMGLDDDFNLRRLERYIALVEGSGVTPVVVLTKADVIADAAALHACERAVRSRIPDRLHLVSVDARDADAARALAPHVQAGTTLVLLGSSGAGKSTLANTLLGSPVQDTGPVREHDSRGKHTTTSRSLLLLPGGACLIDTPGVRTLRPDADERSVAATFGDIDALAARCRFRNCRHADEPGCAVREGIDPDRLRNYHKLLREARRDTMSVLQQRQQLAAWKARGRASRARLKIKRGEA